MYQRHLDPRAAICCLLVLSFMFFSFQPLAFARRARPVSAGRPGRSAQSPPTATITVNTSQAVRTVDPRMFGVNAAVWDSVLGTAMTQSLLADMDNRMLRFPGGSLSDEYHWQTNTTLNNTWTWATGFDAFAPIAVNTNAQLFVTVNYGTGTAQEAADWVRYSNITKGYGFKYWEIGNECYGGWETDQHSVKNDPYTYAVTARDYINLMRSVDPTIKIGVVAVTGEDSYGNNTHTVTNPRTNVTHTGWTPVMLNTLSALGVSPDFLIYHRYEQAPGHESDSGLLQSSSTWSQDAASLRQQLNDYLGAKGSQVELVITEHNSVYSNPGKQTTSLVNGLFYADALGQVLQTEFNAMTWWDLRNGQDATNNLSPSLYGWRQYGDYGIVSSTSDKYPTYYVAKLLKYFARGADTIVNASTDNQLVSAYSAVRQDGSLSVLVVNKSPTTAYASKVYINDYIPGMPANTYSYGIPQDQAAQTGQGSPDVAQAGFPTAGGLFDFTFAPYSATILSLTPTTLSPIDDARYFVHQQYADFLAREPDRPGLEYWTGQIEQCGTDALCIHDHRVAVADAYFFEPEFQQSGAFVYRMYRAGLATLPTFSQFNPDRSQVVGGTSLDQSKTAFALAFVQRPSFLALYPQADAADKFVDDLLGSVKTNSGVDLSSQRSTLIGMYDGTNNGRAAILRQVADNQTFVDGVYNSSFVLLSYFAYLRRDPDQDGFNFWLGQVNNHPLRDLGIQHAMACSFITSKEYQLRFGTRVTHSNGECPQ
jgi:hypothetical protein